MMKQVNRSVVDIQNNISRIDNLVEDVEYNTLQARQ